MLERFLANPFQLRRDSGDRNTLNSRHDLPTQDIGLQRRIREFSRQDLIENDSQAENV